MSKQSEVKEKQGFQKECPKCSNCKFFKTKYVMKENELSTIWNPTIKFRWVDCKKANKETNAVRFSNDIGWGWPDNIVLQQMWQGDKGHQKWIDIPLETES